MHPYKRLAVSHIVYDDTTHQIEYWITVDDWIDTYHCSNVYFPNTEFVDVLMYKGQDWVLRKKPYPESHHLT